MISIRREYIWHGIDLQGNRLTGTSIAKNNLALMTLLKEQNIILLQKKSNFKFQFQKNRFSDKERLKFTEQLSELLTYGFSIIDALKIIRNNDAQQEWLNSTIQQIEQGMSLSEALVKPYHYFNTFYISMLAVGESTGKLAETIQQLLVYLEKIFSIKQKVIKALSYPLLVLIVSACMTLGLIYFVIPQFAETFASFGQQLPLLTRVLLGCANIFSQYGHIIFFILLIFALIMQQLYRHNRWLRYQYHRLLLKTPFIKKLIYSTNTMNWLKVLAIAINAGIPIINALPLAALTIKNQVLKNRLRGLNELIATGFALHTALHQSGVFAKPIIQLIGIGETTGNLNGILSKLALTEEHQFDRLVAKVTVLLEPMLMLLLAGIATLLILAMYIPIFQMGSMI